MIRQLAARGRYSAFRKSFSTSTRRNGYEDTIGYLKIGEHTRVIFQGFTGMFEFLTGRFWK
jgi:succinyl-CoA synthetase alpha subunit